LFFVGPFLDRRNSGTDAERRGGQPGALIIIRHPASGIRHPASGIRHPASGIRHPASGIRHPAKCGFFIKKVNDLDRKNEMDEITKMLQRILALA